MSHTVAGWPGEASMEEWIRSEVRGARSWSELERICTEINAAYQSGDLKLEQVESLVEEVRVRATLLPEIECEEERVWASDLREPSSGEKRRCPCCGGTVWWREGERLVCGICHPRPAWKLDRRRAA